MAKEINATLGGRNYTVAALPIGPSRIWRQKVAKELTTITKQLNVSLSWESSKLSDMGQIVELFSRLINSAGDKVIDLLFEYSPVLRADKEWLLDNAFDEEALALFQEVLKLAFPFGILLELVNGPMGNKTSSSLPSPNGVLPLPASGPVKKNPKK